MAALPSGAAFGSLVHGVLEESDPEAPDLRSELATHTRTQLQWWPVGVAADELADALLPSQLTPLGAAASGLRLVDIPLRDRLCELDFEFPLTGGDRPETARPDVHLRDLAPLLAAHLPAGDPLASYAGQLTGALGDQSLRGYLSGSIDVVLRVPGDPVRPARPPLRRRRLQDQPARGDRGAGHLGRLRPRRDGGRDAAQPLPAPGAALLRRPASLPALAAAVVRTRGASRRRPLPVPARDVRSRRPRSSTATSPASSTGRRRPRW